MTVAIESKTVSSSILCADSGRLLCGSSFGPTYEPERDPRGTGGRQHQPPPCPYGSACRETSARHFIEFSHMASHSPGRNTLFRPRFPARKQPLLDDLWTACSVVVLTIFV